jgi:hypothetical protein
VCDQAGTLFEPAYIKSIGVGAGWERLPSSGLPGQTRSLLIRRLGHERGVDGGQRRIEIEGRRMPVEGEPDAAPDR